MGVRWAPQRRANRASEELNIRLKLRIQPFKLTRRQVLIDRPVFDPEVLRAAEEYSRRFSNLIHWMQYCATAIVHLPSSPGLVGRPSIQRPQ
jgi:hypothetical protein